MHCPEPFDPLGSYPILLSRNFRHERAILKLQTIKVSTPMGCGLRFGFLRTEN